jgi:hypothetical protein
VRTAHSASIDGGKVASRLRSRCDGDHKTALLRVSSASLLRDVMQSLTSNFLNFRRQLARFGRQSLAAGRDGEDGVPGLWPYSPRSAPLRFVGRGFPAPIGQRTAFRFPRVSHVAEIS